MLVNRLVSGDKGSVIRMDCKIIWEESWEGVYLGAKLSVLVLQPVNVRQSGVTNLCTAAFKHDVLHGCVTVNL